MKDIIDLSQMESVLVNVGKYRRLRRYWVPSTRDFWDELWGDSLSQKIWNKALTGTDGGYWQPLYRKYLKPGVRVLEAGCGLGQIVLFLRYLGFNAHGVDIAPRTIKMLQKRFPDVPFKQGDIRHLPYKSESFDGYISLGVIEHFTHGQDKILEEAARILRLGGKIFLSVPVLNGYRMLRAMLGMYRTRSSLPFFEDCYSREELEFLLKNAGFFPIDVQYSNMAMTFVQESFIRPFYRPIEGVRYVRGAIDRFLNLLLPRHWFGHMIMIVAEKAALSDKKRR